jgi:hypothetical protein
MAALAPSIPVSGGKKGKLPRKDMIPAAKNMIA